MPAGAAELVGRAGQLMLVASALLLLLALLALLPRALRVRTRLRGLIALAKASSAAIEGDVARLEQRRKEMKLTLAAGHGLRRKLTHPLTVALLQSYGRRRSRSAAGR